MRPPEALLLALLRGERAAPGDADPRWPQLVALAERHGVAPLLHETVPDLPPQARAQLRRRRTEALQDWARLSGALQRALAHLPQAVVLKGAFYAQELYPSQELRPCGDVDLLALEGSLPWRWHPDTRAHESAPGWHEQSFLDPGAGKEAGGAEIVVDLHRDFSQPQRSRLDPRAIVARAVPGAGARVPDPDDAVVLHAWNLALHELRAPLVQLVDLALLWPRCRPAEVLRRAAETRTLAALAGALELLLRLASSRGTSSSAPGVRFGGAPLDRAGLAEALDAARAGLALPRRRALSLVVARYDLARGPTGRLEQLGRKAVFIDRAADLAQFAWAQIRLSTGPGRRR